jgi:hypothetical protein
MIVGFILMKRSSWKQDRQPAEQRRPPHPTYIHRKYRREGVVRLHLDTIGRDDGGDDERGGRRLRGRSAARGRKFTAKKIASGP